MIHHQRLAILVHHLRRLSRITLPIPKPPIEVRRPHLRPLVAVQIRLLPVRRKQPAALRDHAVSNGQLLVQLALGFGKVSIGRLVADHLRQPLGKRDDLIPFRHIRRGLRTNGAALGIRHAGAGLGIAGLDFTGEAAIPFFRRPLLGGALDVWRDGCLADRLHIVSVTGLKLLGNLICSPCVAGELLNAVWLLQFGQLFSQQCERSISPCLCCAGPHARISKGVPRSPAPSKTLVALNGVLDFVEHGALLLSLADSYHERPVSHLLQRSTNTRLRVNLDHDLTQGRVSREQRRMVNHHIQRQCVHAIETERHLDGFGVVQICANEVGFAIAALHGCKNIIRQNGAHNLLGNRIKIHKPR